MARTEKRTPTGRLSRSEQAAAQQCVQHGDSSPATIRGADVNKSVCSLCVHHRVRHVCRRGRSEGSHVSTQGAYAQCHLELAVDKTLAEGVILITYGGV